MSKIRIKRGTTAPVNGTLDNGELGFDTTDKRVYIGTGLTVSDEPLIVTTKVVRLI